MSKQQAGIFDEQFKLERISKLGDPLEKLIRCIDWKIFRPILEKALIKEAKGPGGRPAYDYIMMFKILITAVSEVWFILGCNFGNYFLFFIAKS